MSPQPGAPGFTDVGGLLGGDPHFYLVRAVDADGDPGGLGGQLPDGIHDLVIGPGGSPGTIELSWSPVTTDFDGNPTTIAHYVVFADDTPVSRAEIRDGSVPQLGGPVSGTALEIVPLGPKRYYSVLAVDTRGNLSPF